MAYGIKRGGAVTNWKGDVGQGWHSLLDDRFWLKTLCGLCEHERMIQSPPEGRSK